MGFCLDFILVGQVQLPLWAKALYPQKPPLIVNRSSLIVKLVRLRRLELPRVLPHSDLNAARLPFRHNRTDGRNTTRGGIKQPPFCVPFCVPFWN